MKKRMDTAMPQRVAAINFQDGAIVCSSRRGEENARSAASKKSLSS